MLFFFLHWLRRMSNLNQSIRICTKTSKIISVADLYPGTLVKLSDVEDVVVCFLAQAARTKPIDELEERMDQIDANAPVKAQTSEYQFEAKILSFYYCCGVYNGVVFLCSGSTASSSETGFFFAKPGFDRNGNVQMTNSAESEVYADSIKQIPVVFYFSTDPKTKASAEKLILESAHAAGYSLFKFEKVN